MAERPGEKTERERREEREARERIEQRVEQPWPGPGESRSQGGAGRAGTVHAGDSPSTGSPASGGGPRGGASSRSGEEAGREIERGRQGQEMGRAVEHGRAQAEQALEQGREAVRQQAESLFHSGSEHAAHFIERASEALREGASSLERDEGSRAAAPYVRRAASGLERFAETLRRDDLSGLLHRAEGVARRRPVAFIGGAAAVGIGIGRFLRSSGARRHGIHGTAGMEAGSGTRGAQRDESAGVPEQPAIAGPHAPPIGVSPVESETRRNS